MGRRQRTKLRIGWHQNGAWRDVTKSLACCDMSKRVRGAAINTGLLVEWLRQREEDMVALLAELVAIPTENPPGKNYRACADFLENRLQQCGLDCERLEVDGAKEGTG